MDNLDERVVDFATYIIVYNSDQQIPAHGRRQAVPPKFSQKCSVYMD